MYFLRIFLLFALALLSSTYQAAAGPNPYTKQDCTTSFSKFVEVQQLPEGPRLVIRSPRTGVRDYDSINELKIGQYNMENIMNYRTRWKRDGDGQWIKEAESGQRPDARWDQLAKNILREDPDVMAWEEIEDLQIAKEFVRTKLGNKYKVILVEGNDMRGIDVAFVVKRNLPYDFVVQSHRNLDKDNRKIFSRDLLSVSFLPPGASDTSEPLLQVHVTHNKAMIDSPNDPKGTKLRTLQMATQAEIVKKQEAKFPNVPSFIVGDLNADPRTAPEYSPLWNTGFIDGFNADPTPVPVGERVTQSYFPGNGGPTVHNQLDAILVSKRAQEIQMVKDTKVVRDLDLNGNEVGIPQTFEEKKTRPSDHRMLVMTIDLTKRKSELAKQ